MIKVKGLHKNFGSLQVLRGGIDLKVQKGKVVVIIGASGSGKSTLLRCLNLLERPQKGEIFIGGQNITGPAVDINRVRREVGMVFQQFNLFPPTWMPFRTSYWHRSRSPGSPWKRGERAGPPTSGQGRPS